MYLVTSLCTVTYCKFAFLKSTPHLQPLTIHAWQSKACCTIAKKPQCWSTRYHHTAGWQVTRSQHRLNGRNSSPAESDSMEGTHRLLNLLDAVGTIIAGPTMPPTALISASWSSKTDRCSTSFSGATPHIPLRLTSAPTYCT